MTETDTVPFHHIQVVNKHDSTAEDRGTKRFRCLRVKNLQRTNFVKFFRLTIGHDRFIRKQLNISQFDIDFITPAADSWYLQDVVATNTWTR
jgi:hypothetical protein